MRLTDQRHRYYLSMALANIMLGGLLWLLTSPVQAAPVPVKASQPSSTIEPPTTNSHISGRPTHLTIASIEVDLDVLPGVFDPASQSWTTNDDDAFFAANSMLANDLSGTTLLYGHARWSVFGALPDIRSGDEAIIDTDSGYKFIYRYESMRDVVPTDTSIFTASGPPTLVLQTCSGAWDAYRSLYSFRLVSESSV